MKREWNMEAVGKIQADFNRTSDTHLILHRFLKDADIRIYLKDESLSTSGSDEKFFYANGRTWSHLIDPRTGSPAQGVDAVSVLADAATDSEAWTKPFFINGRAWTRAHRRPGLRVFFCATGKTCEWVQ